jgi:hypothetical protein
VKIVFKQYVPANLQVAMALFKEVDADLDGEKRYENFCLAQIPDTKKAALERL